MRPPALSVVDAPRMDRDRQTATDWYAKPPVQQRDVQALSTCAARSHAPGKRRAAATYARHGSSLAKYQWKCANVLRKPG